MHSVISLGDEQISCAVLVDFIPGVPLIDHTKPRKYRVCIAKFIPSEASDFSFETTSNSTDRLTINPIAFI